MKFFLKTFSLIFASGSYCYGISFNEYHSLEEINQYLIETATRHKEVEFYNLGRSEEGRPINYITLSRSTNSQTPSIYLNGTHHGNEKASTEATLAIINYLTTRKNNISIERLLRKFRFVIQPVVNPDGHHRNSRLSASGIDPNRDYPTPFSNKKPFQLKETRLVSSLMKKYRFEASAAFHSGVEAVLWPWCST